MNLVPIPGYGRRFAFAGPVEYVRETTTGVR